MRRRQPSIKPLSLALTESAPLLHTRKQASVLLGGLSIASMIRLERLGRLKPIKLTGAPSAQTYYSHNNLLELAKGANAE